MKKLLALMLAAALALSLVGCGAKRDYSMDFTGKLDITSFEMTMEDILLLEYIQLYNAENDTKETLEGIKRQMEEAEEIFSLEDLEWLLEMCDKEYEINDKNDDRTIVTFDGGHIYGISKEDGKLDFVKWTMSETKTDFTLGVWEAVIEEGIKNWTNDYGEPEVDKNERFYTWYGNVNGENASLSVEKGNGITTASMMELDRVKE